MILDGVPAQRRELKCELPAHRPRERRSDADVLEPPALVVEAEKQRAYRVLSGLVPAESGHHAFGGAHVLHLDHRALAGLVGTVRRLRDHAVEAGALALLEPLPRHVAG